MKRKTALEIIRIEFAKHGEPTTASTRVYIENRISADAYNMAVVSGLKTYRRV